MNEKIRNFIEENLEKTVRYEPESSGTLIGLPYKHTVPCVDNKFQELYYWDTYFVNAGLIKLKKIDLAKSNIDNMFYLVDKYGFMPNGSRTFYLNRSQPPFLSLMVRELYEVTKDNAWLKFAYMMLTKEYEFWQTKRVTKTGLNGYTNYELDESQYDKCYEQLIERTSLKREENPSKELKKEMFLAATSLYESGWDCSTRYLANGHKTDAVDLNSLLYILENNMAYFAEILDNGEKDLWKLRSEKRKELMQNLWSNEKGAFLDKNFETNNFSDYLSAASFFPLFCGVATEKQANETLKTLTLVESLYGIMGGQKEGSTYCQWDYPNIWAPVQYVVYKGLKNYGFTDDAKRIAQKYIDLIENNFDKTENFWEKYNGETGEVSSYENKKAPMMGWTACVYIYFCSELGLL